MRNAIALLLVTLSSSCSNDDGDNPYALARNEDTVVNPGEIYRSCAADNDCTLVGNACDGCCKVAAISSELNDRFDAEFAAACKGYTGAICDCQPLELVARCVSGACTELPAPN